MKNVFLVSGTYIAALIGAGLASGAESAAFFARYGKFGLLGAFVCSLIFGIFIFALIIGCRRFNTYTVEEYCTAAYGRITSVITNACIAIFLMCVYSAMTAGFGTMCGKIFGWPKFSAAAVFNALCIMAAMLPQQRILRICGSLGLVLGASVAVCAVYAAARRGIEAFAITDSWALSAVSYSGYNILSAFALMCPLCCFIRSAKQAAAVGTLSFLAIFSVLACLWGVISLYYGKIDLGEMPMLTLAARHGNMFFMIYAAILFAAIFTTALSCAFGIYNSVCRFAPHTAAVIIIFFSAQIISAVGFGRIVDSIYRLCGIIGIFVPIMCVMACIKTQKKVKIKENKR